MDILHFFRNVTVFLVLNVELEAINDDFILCMYIFVNVCKCNIRVLWHTGRQACDGGVRKCSNSLLLKP